MKLLLFFLLLPPLTSLSQDWYELYPYSTLFNFEDTSNLPYLSIDMVGSSNAWEIGIPQKNIFNSSYSIENSIITDSLSSYMINDTFSFTIKIPFHGVASEYYLSGYYYSDCDSLKDFGKIEYSYNNGDNWVLISTDTATFTNSQGNLVNFPSSYFFNSGLPILTGKSAGWQSFSINLLDSYNLFGNGNIGDTSIFRFSFISDSIAENRDGLMFDDLLIVDVNLLEIKEVINEIVVIYPNPNNSNKLRFQKPLDQIQIYNLNGQLLVEEIGHDLLEINIETLRKGQYIVRGINAKNSFVSKFIRD